MDFKLARLPENDDELWLLVKLLWGVTIPRQQVCVDHVAPFTAFADAYWGRNSLNPEGEIQDMALWHGSRGLSGKSYMLAVLGLTKAVLLGCDVNLLGGSFEQSKNIHTHMRNSWDHDGAPEYMVAADGANEVRLTNKAKIRPLTASQKTVRGPHPPFLLLDEIDEMDIEILDAALGQPLPQKNYLNEIVKPYTVMCSTWQNPEGTFTEIKRRAEERDIPMYAWCFKETANPIDGWLTEETIAAKKAMIPTEMWRTEYELGEPAIGNRAFVPEKVEEAFELPMEPIHQRVAKDYEEYVFEEPIGDAYYVAGADWGKDRDYTVISVGRVDCKPHRLVYFMRVNRRPYPVMAKYFNDAIAKYNAQAEHDATGVGNAVNDLLDGSRARKFVLVGAARSNMLTEFVAAVENGQWKFPKIKIAYTEMKFCQVGDLYSNAQEYHLPDTVCAFALMEHMAKRLAPAVDPVVLRKNPNALNHYQIMFEPHRAEEDITGFRQDGVVTETSSSTALSLLA